jgi:23S rRNA pseudouridine955/2504/2580 synthase
MSKVEHSRVRLVSVASEEAGQRLDNYLLRVLKGVPRSRIYRLVRKGEVRVNRRRSRPEYRLQPGDQLRIPPVRMAERGEPARPASDARARVRAAVVFENERLLVLSKPPGMAVHGGSGLSYGVIEALRAERPGEPFLELVHRLDRETSGCLLIAKRRSALRHLHQVIREGAMEKRYLTLMMGRGLGGDRTVSAPLRKNQLQGGERMVRVDPEGKPACTRFTPLQRFTGATLTEAELYTGRTHQIRVHAAHIGQPLAGDSKYGDPAFNRAMGRLGLRRLFLHAHSLRFPAPGSGASDLLVTAPLPEDLRTVLDALETEAAGTADAGA